MRTLAVSLAFMVLSCTFAFAAEEPEAPAEPEEPVTQGEDGGLPAAGLSVEVVTLAEPVRVAYLEGTLSDDIYAMFQALVESAVEQDLFAAKTGVGALFPFAMAEGWDGETVVYAALSLAEGVEPLEPLKVFVIPPGDFLKTVHQGPYEKSEKTWMTLMAWAAAQGIELGTGPAGELYLNSPDDVPEEELLTEIYIPLARGHGLEPGHLGDIGGEGEPGDMPLPELDVKVITIEAGLPVAYIAGTLGDDMVVLFESMMAEAEAQDLFDDTTRVGSILPGGMQGDWDEDSAIYAALSIPEGAVPAAPFEIFDVPVGEYLMFEHIGPYERTGETFGVFMMWAAGHGIEFGEGPIMAHYVSNPETTPSEELVTEIYVPLAPGQADFHAEDEDHAEDDEDHDEDHDGS